MYYVYVLTDPFRKYGHRHCRYLFKEEPFYVGKGSGFRALVHLKQASRKECLENPEKLARIRALQKKEYLVVPRILKWFDSEADAFALEIDLIRSIGRLDLGTGPLTNRTSGGDGIKGLVREACSLDTRRKISETVRRFLAAESPSNKRKRYLNQAAAFEARSPEEKVAQAEVKRAIMLDRHASLTASEKTDIYAKVSQSLLEYYASLTERQRKDRRQKVSEGVKAWATSRPKGSIQRANKARRLSWRQKPQSEIREFTAKRLKATDLKEAARKRSKTLRSRTPEQIRASVDKRLATMGLRRR